MSDSVDKLRAQADQGTAFIADIMPPLWRRIYKNCQDQGFTEPESFKLLQTLVLQRSRHRRTPCTTKS